MALSDIEYQALEDIVGPENITREPAILETYNQCWGHKAVFDQKWSTRPAAVVMPGSTEECQSIVKACNRCHIRLKPFSSGFEIVAFALENDRGILLDLKRMDHIIEIDVKNMHAVVEPYVNIYRLQREAMRHGVTVGSIGAGPSAGVIAGACCHFGGGTTMVSTGGLGRNILGVEWVLPTGDVLPMGTAETGVGWFSADGPGPSLRGVLRGRSGANGGHGIISKVSVKLYPWYGPPDVKFAAEAGKPPSAKRLTEVPQGYKVFLFMFLSQKDMFEALIRIGRAELTTALMGALLFPYGEGNDEQYAAIEEMKKAGVSFTEVATKGVILVIGADTPRGLEYREKCLMKIAGELGGFPVPLPPSEQSGAFAAAMWHFGFVTAAFRRSGDFFVSPTGDGSPDMMLTMRRRAEALLVPYMEKGLLQQLGTPEMFLVPSEHSSVGFHEENVSFYDPWDPDSLGALRQLAKKTEDPDGEFRSLGVPHLGGGLQIEWKNHVHQNWGPLYDNYDVWLRKIREMLDPNDVGDWSAYIPSIFP
ncbi:MAG: FAD-binding oxidoreductase [Thermodesulfobacteriota bacterium]